MFSILLFFFKEIMYYYYQNIPKTKQIIIGKASWF